MIDGVLQKFQVDLDRDICSLTTDGASVMVKLGKDCSSTTQVHQNILVKGRIHLLHFLKEDPIYLQIKVGNESVLCKNKVLEL